MDKSEFYDFMLSVITDMERQGRYSTAHVYHCALKSAVKYGGHSLRIEDLTPGWLQSYQEYLLKQSLLWNTISTYMRMLRAVYNRAVDMGLAPYIPRQFKNVFTGRYANHQRALKKGEIKRAQAAPEKQAFLLPVHFLLRLAARYFRKCSRTGKIHSETAHLSAKRIRTALRDQRLRCPV